MLAIMATGPVLAAEWVADRSSMVRGVPCRDAHANPASHRSSASIRSHREEPRFRRC